MRLLVVLLYVITLCPWLVSSQSFTLSGQSCFATPNTSLSFVSDEPSTATSTSSSVLSGSASTVFVSTQACGSTTTNTSCYTRFNVVTYNANAVQIGFSYYSALDQPALKSIFLGSNSVQDAVSTSPDGLVSYDAYNIGLVNTGSWPSSVLAETHFQIACDWFTGNCTFSTLSVSNGTVDFFAAPIAGPAGPFYLYIFASPATLISNITFGSYTCSNYPQSALPASSSTPWYESVYIIIPVAAVLLLVIVLVPYFRCIRKHETRKFAAIPLVDKPVP